MQLSAGTPWKALPPPILSFWGFFNWNQALGKKIHFYWKQDMRRVFACVAIFFLQFAPGDSLFFSRTWTMKVSNKGSSHSWGKDAGGQGSSLNPWWGQWDGLCWSFCPGWDFTGSCFTKPQGGNSKAGNWKSPARWDSRCSQTCGVWPLVLQGGHFHQGQPWAEGLPPSL